MVLAHAEVQNASGQPDLLGAQHDLADLDRDQREPRERRPSTVGVVDADDQPTRDLPGERDVAGSDRTDRVSWRGRVFQPPVPRPVVARGQVERIDDRIRHRR